MSAIPPLSVVMPVYNAGEYLKQAVDSILQQDFPDFEFIIVDDASTDSSLDYLMELRDPRLRISRNERNMGATETAAKCMSLCRAPFIARMDADDISDPQRFAKQVYALSLDPETILVGTGANTFGAWSFHWQTPEKTTDLRAYMLFDCPFPQSSVMMRKHALTKFNLRYDREMEAAEDYDLWERAGEAGKIIGINQPLVQCRVHPTSFSARIADKVPFFADKVRRRALKTYLDFDLDDTDVIAMRRISGVYRHRFARTVAEIEETHDLYQRLRARMVQVSATSPDFSAACLREIEARWNRTLNWAEGEARESHLFREAV